jgi:hypothetical protein
MYCAGLPASHNQVNTASNKQANKTTNVDTVSQKYEPPTALTLASIKFPLVVHGGRRPASAPP